jgi:hypothetical protein
MNIIFIQQPQFALTVPLRLLPVVRKFEKSGRRIEFYLGRILGILELSEVGRDRGMMSDE